MSKTIDIGILEHLASKICHDLISPIGAINNGMEFLEDLGPDADKEVIELIAFSAQQASAKLQAYRMAYGIGGADTHIRPEDVYKVIDLIVSAEGKVKQNWDPHGNIGPEELPKGFSKVLVSVLLLAMECLPKGGTLEVMGDGESTIVKATGENAALRDLGADALSLALPRESLEPKYIHAYISGLLAQYHGFEIIPGETGTDFTSFKISRAA